MPVSPPRVSGCARRADLCSVADVLGQAFCVEFAIDRVSWLAGSSASWFLVRTNASTISAMLRVVMQDSSDEPAALALEFLHEQDRQLMLEPQARDLSIFPRFFSEDREQGVFAYFATDVSDAQVLEVLQLDYSVSVLSATADRAVVEIRTVERKVWQTADEPDPYMMSFNNRLRFLLRHHDGRWRIVDFGGHWDMLHRQGIEFLPSDTRY